jgi:hypothetical protein
MAKDCPNCGYPTLNNASSCDKCGYKFKDVIKCTYCGEYNLIGWDWCIKCKKKLYANNYAYNEEETLNEKNTAEKIITQRKLHNEIIFNDQENNNKIDLEISFFDVLYKTVEVEGIVIFDNIRRCKAILLDNAKGHYKKEIRLLIIALEEGCHKMIINSEDIEITERVLVQQLRNNCLLDQDAAKFIILMLIKLLEKNNKFKNNM